MLLALNWPLGSLVCLHTSHSKTDLITGTFSNYTITVHWFDSKQSDYFEIAVIQFINTLTDQYIAVYYVFPLCFPLSPRQFVRILSREMVQIWTSNKIKWQILTSEWKIIERKNRKNINDLQTATFHALHQWHY